MNAAQYIKGKIRIRILTADIPKVLSILSFSKVQTEDISVVDDITLEITVYRFSSHKIKKLLGTYCQDIFVSKSFGLYPQIKRAIKRPVMLFGIFLLFSLTIYLQGRILFVEVDGNTQVSSKLIKERAAQSGICFGAARKSVQSESVKNNLLQSIPHLQWAGVTTRGCVATISVKEKNLAAQEQSLPPGISSIIAERDGIIQEITVTEGTAVCQVGQKVIAGQTLISGFTESEGFIKGTHANGEVLAETNRNMTVCALSKGAKRDQLLRVEKRTYVQFGKKLINLWNNSRISPTTCVRIYSKQDITLPGGYILPAALIQETIFYYSTASHTQKDIDQFQWVENYACGYLRDHMIPRKMDVIAREAQPAEDIYFLNLDFVCQELIGVRKKEELIY